MPIPPASPTFADLAFTIDPNVKRDAYFDDNKYINFGKLNGESDQAYGKIGYDSGTNEFRIYATKDGDGTYPALVFYAGGSEAARINSAQQLLVGVTTPRGDEVARFYKSFNGLAIARVDNLTDGAAAAAMISFRSNGNVGSSIYVTSSSYSSADAPGGSFIIDGGTRGDLVFRVGGTAKHRFWFANTSQAEVVLGGLIRAGDGTQAAPSWSFLNDTNTGVWSVGSDVMAFGTGNAESFRIDGNQTFLLGTLSREFASSIAEFYAGINDPRQVTIKNNVDGDACAMTLAVIGGTDASKAQLKCYGPSHATYAGVPFLSFITQTHARITVSPGKALVFYSGSSEKARLTDSGYWTFSDHVYPVSDNAINLGSDTYRWKTITCGNIVTGDLELRDPKSGAHWRIFEEPDTVMIENKRTGKKYRIPLVEVMN